jgi:hypothetical protein
MAAKISFISSAIQGGEGKLSDPEIHASELGELDWADTGGQGRGRRAHHLRIG